MALSTLAAAPRNIEEALQRPSFPAAVNNGSARSKLPQELVDHIVDLLSDELPTLKVCSLVSRA